MDRGHVGPPDGRSVVRSVDLLAGVRGRSPGRLQLVQGPRRPRPQNAPSDSWRPLGEIFVIGVDPEYAGKGLGRPLALAGLARLHERGLTTGSLFVAAENERALRLYRGIGFTVHRVDRAYEREVEAA